MNVCSVLASGSAGAVSSASSRWRRASSPNPALNEATLRARIAAGSRDAADYLDLGALLAKASHFAEAASILEKGLQLDLRNKG